ncbi:VOC family protein [Saccharothrix luteola]|uniref:VOC family protein n=1 Tax=Saccharothrix luteola TaxID=2893018 RepID=UPI001E43D539|nr:VOC family protein [Saccharothrix luteola]MCC8251102.1 VOC family protein [Saccharothrix luteola]
MRTDAQIERFRRLSVGPAGRTDVEIVLEEPRMGRPADDATAMMELPAKGSLGAAIFRVDDCDATFERLRAAGAEVMQEPMDQVHGVRDRAFRDPSANHLRFSGPLKG